MADFASELLAARMAQRDAWEAEVRHDKALESRGRAVARAWACRPGGTEWDDVLRAVNDGLPADARVRVNTLRRDERIYRDRRTVEAAATEA